MLIAPNNSDHDNNKSNQSNILLLEKEERVAQRRVGHKQNRLPVQTGVFVAVNRNRFIA